MHRLPWGFPGRLNRWPIRGRPAACANVFDLYVAAGRNALYARRAPFIPV